MDQIRTLLASRLKQLRSSKGWGQAQVAEAAGLEVNTVSRYERALITPSIEHLLNLARAFGVSPMDILPLADSDTQRLSFLRQQLADRALKIDIPQNLEALISAADTFILSQKPR